MSDVLVRGALLPHGFRPGSPLGSADRVPVWAASLGAVNGPLRGRGRRSAPAAAVVIGRLIRGGPVKRPDARYGAMP